MITLSGCAIGDSCTDNGGIIFLIILAVIAFLCLNFANTYLPVAKTTVFSNVTTVVSVLAGTIFLNEKLSIEVLVAIIAIITGVVGVQLINIKQ